VEAPVSAATEQTTLGKDLGVNVGAIEKELANLWRSAAEDKKEVTRACSWNLVVYCADDPVFDAAKKIVDDAVRHVPSRTLMLKPRPYAAVVDGKDVDAWVSANCQIAPGGGKLLCTEEVTVEARGKSGVDTIPGIIRALQVPDVPTALWWAGPPPTDPSAVRILLSGVDRLVFDTSMLPGDGGLSKLAHVGGLLDGLVLTDVNWLRTGGWRSVIASLFDPPIGADPLSRLKRVRIEATQKGVPAAKLMLGWLASRLAWGTPERTEAGQLAWRVPARADSLRADIDTNKVTTERATGIRAIHFETTTGDRYSLVDAPNLGPGGLEGAIPGSSGRTLQAHENPVEQLLVAALGSRGRDRLYPIALHRAVELDR
jgi:glucose-6-phosphate dehydrogenase assembly protein OpcA